MAELNLDKSKTALLMADFATIGIGENPIAQERHTLNRAPYSNVILIEGV